jgi:alkylation response protein AidB-like acyl-CoA dehydrogenase
VELNLSPSEQAFAKEVRAFIEARLPADIERKVREDRHLDRDDYMRWQQVLGERGWFTGNWPASVGGQEWTAVQSYIFNTIAGELNCPELQVFGPSMVGPVLYTYGTEAQKAQHLPSIRDSSVWWCQGYSEPASGSDLASLSTRADDAGDDYIVNGQKIWTSYAHWADWIFCLVRTSREARQQSGISFLLIDMKTPGIEVQPIRMMDGTHSLNAVFFTDVRVPKANRIGEEGLGWTYAKFLLEHERVENSNLRFITQELQKLKRMARRVRSGAAAGSLADDPLFQAQLSAVEAQFKTLEMGVLRLLSNMQAGVPAGAGASSFIKVRGTEIAQKVLELALAAAGPDAQPYQPELLFSDADVAPIGPLDAVTPASSYFWRRAMTIYGGSTEIQKNIMAKHVLGL